MDFQKYIVLNDFKQVESYMGFFKTYNKPDGLNYSIKTISEPLDASTSPFIWEESPLQTASENAVDLDIINLLLENGADPNYTNINGNALHFAMENEDPVWIVILELLLNKGAGPYVLDKNGETPYNIAKNHGDIKAMEILVDHMSTMPNELYLQAKNKFMELIARNDYISVEKHIDVFLFDKKLDGLNFITKFTSPDNVLDDYSPIGLACENAIDLNIIKLLLDKGADINYISGKSHSALTGALLNLERGITIYEIVEFLLKNGALKYQIDGNGRSPFDNAVSFFNQDYKIFGLFKYYSNTEPIKRMQKIYRNTLTLKKKKRTNAAKRIQSRTRGNLSRQRLTLKKAWKGTNAFDPIMYDDEDIFEYLQSDPKNFVLNLPGSNSYEAVNLNDLLKMSMNKDLYDYFRIGSYNTFYECHKYDINDYQKGSKNVDANTQYMKIGIANFVVLVPNWFFGNFGYRYERYPIPEPRIFKLEKLKVVNSLVSSKLYHYLDKLDEIALIKYNAEVEEAIRDDLPQEEIDMMEPDWPLVSGDHCSEKKPIQVYKLVPVHTHEDDYLADFANELKQFSSQSSETSRSSGVPRRLFHSNSSNSDLTRRFNALQDVDPSLQQDEEFRNLNLS